MEISTAPDAPEELDELTSGVLTTNFPESDEALDPDCKTKDPPKPKFAAPAAMMMSPPELAPAPTERFMSPDLSCASPVIRFIVPELSFPAFPLLMDTSPVSLASMEDM